MMTTTNVDGFRFDDAIVRLKAHEMTVEVWGEDVDCIYIEWIEAKQKGAGRKTLEALMAHADEKGLPVVLDFDNDALIDYYKSFGFEADPCGGERMMRPARKPEAIPPAR